MNEMFSMSVSFNQRLRLWAAKPIKKTFCFGSNKRQNHWWTNNLSVVDGCPWVLWLSVVDFSAKLLLYSGTHTSIDKFNTFAVNLPSNQCHQANVSMIQRRVQSEIGYFSLQLTNIKRRLEHIAGGVACVKKVDLEVGLVLGGTGWRLDLACSFSAACLSGWCWEWPEPELVAAPLQPDADPAEWKA